jgi:hypothetical protein
MILHNLPEVMKFMDILGALHCCLSGVSHRLCIALERRAFEKLAESRQRGA